MDPVSGAAILVLVLSLLGFIARWAWTHTHQRIDELNKAVIDHESEDRRRHEEIIRVTTRLETQMSRFVSDMESEKRTRADVNKEIFLKLDRIGDRLPERRDEVRDR